MFNINNKIYAVIDDRVQYMTIIKTLKKNIIAQSIQNNSNGAESAKKLDIKLDIKNIMSYELYHKIFNYFNKLDNIDIYKLPEELKDEVKYMNEYSLRIILKNIAKLKKKHKKIKKRRETIKNSLKTFKFNQVNNTNSTFIIKDSNLRNYFINCLRKKKMFVLKFRSHKKELVISDEQPPQNRFYGDKLHLTIHSEYDERKASSHIKFNDEIIPLLFNNYLLKINYKEFNKLKELNKLQEYNGLNNVELYDKYMNDNNLTIIKDRIVKILEKVNECIKETFYKSEESNTFEEAAEASEADKTSEAVEASEASEATVSEAITSEAIASEGAEAESEATEELGAESLLEQKPKKGKKSKKESKKEREKERKKKIEMQINQEKKYFSEKLKIYKLDVLKCEGYSKTVNETYDLYCKNIDEIYLTFKKYCTKQLKKLNNLDINISKDSLLSIYIDILNGIIEENNKYLINKKKFDNIFKKNILKYIKEKSNNKSIYIKECLLNIYELSKYDRFINKLNYKNEFIEIFKNINTKYYEIFGDNKFININEYIYISKLQKKIYEINL